MKKCFECNGLMKEKSGIDPNGFEYNYYKCTKCSDEVLDMKQLHKVAEKYWKAKRYRAKISRWGTSLGIRIPKKLIKEYKLKDKEEVYIFPDKNSLRILPA